MPFDSEQAIELALARVRCPWCQISIRPCNFDRHVLSRHFQQLTVYDELRELLDREREAARD
jgi:hypothetical protein